MSEKQKSPAIRIFPSQHPFVPNEDGSASNVKMATVTFDVYGKPKHFVIPTMVRGIELPIEDAINVARQYGLMRYPSFNDITEAEKWIEQNHGNIDEYGYLLK